MSLQKEAKLRFCGSVGGFALLDLPVEEQLGILTPSAQLQELGTGHRPGDTAGEGERRMDRGRLRTPTPRGGIQSWGCRLVPCRSLRSSPVAEQAGSVAES